MTGGARRLGRALSVGLAEAGCDVFIHYRNSAAAADRAAHEVRALGRVAAGAAADLSLPEQIDDLFEAFDVAFGRLDILVNSAASFERTPFDETTVAEWDAAQALNLRAPFLMRSARGPHARRDRAERKPRGNLGRPVS